MKVVFLRSVYHRSRSFCGKTSRPDSVSSHVKLKTGDVCPRWKRDYVENQRLLISRMRPTPPAPHLRRPRTVWRRRQKLTKIETLIAPLCDLRQPEADQLRRRHVLHSGPSTVDHNDLPRRRDLWPTRVPRSGRKLRWLPRQREFTAQVLLLRTRF